MDAEWRPVAEGSERKPEKPAGDSQEAKDPELARMIAMFNFLRESGYTLRILPGRGGQVAGYGGAVGRDQRGRLHALGNQAAAGHGAGLQVIHADVVCGDSAGVDHAAALLFSLAMEIFLDKGRIAIQESSREELTIAILQKMTMLLMEKNLQGARFPLELPESVRQIVRIEADHNFTASVYLDPGLVPALIHLCQRPRRAYPRRSGYYIGEGAEEEN